MTFALGQKIALRFEPEVRFFRGWLDQPRAVGSIVPTSAKTARRMASVIDASGHHPVLELGPGTGVVTDAILATGLQADRLVAIEYSAEFHKRLTARYPHSTFLRGDAFDLQTTLGAFAGTTFDSVVSCLPLLNFAVNRRVRLMNDLLDRVTPGRPVVQMSYGPKPPAPADDGYRIRHLDTIFRNLPPVRLWLYSRPAS